MKRFISLTPTLLLLFLLVGCAIPSDSDFVVAAREKPVPLPAALGGGRSSERALPKRQHDGIFSVAFSPDGRYLVSGGGELDLFLWEVHTGRRVRKFKVIRDPNVSDWISRFVVAVAFSPDGKQILSGQGDRTLRLWEKETGAQIKIFRGHEHGIRSISFTPNGRFIVSGGHDHTVRVWETGREISVLRGHLNNIESLALSPDGRYIASGSIDGTVRLWDQETAVKVKTFDVNRMVEFVAFSPDGGRIISVSIDGSIGFWETKSGKQVSILEGSHQDSVWAAALSPDNRLIATGDSLGEVHVREVATGKKISLFKVSGKFVRTVAFRSLALGGRGNVVHLWEIQTGREIRTFGPVQSGSEEGAG